MVMHIFTLMWMKTFVGQVGKQQDRSDIYIVSTVSQMDNLLPTNVLNKCHRHVR